jgi:uncharacterized protein (TIGR02996 family)
MTHMSDRAALLRTILANPADDAPRLIYADWCDENGEGGRAAFIRLQIRRAREGTPGGGLCPKEEALLEAGFRAGWNDFPAWLGEWWWARGFVERVRLPAADWLAHADALLAEHPVTNVTLTTMPALFWWDSDRGWVDNPHGDTFRLFDPKERCEARWPGVTFTLPRTRLVNVPNELLEGYDIAGYIRREMAASVSRREADYTDRLLNGDPAAPLPGGVITYPG